MRLYLVVVKQITWGTSHLLRDELEMFPAIHERHAQWLADTWLADLLAEEEPVCQAEVAIREIDPDEDRLGFLAWLAAWKEDDRTAEMAWQDAVEARIVEDVQFPMLAGKLVEARERRGTGPLRLTKEQWERRAGV